MLEAKRLKIADRREPTVESALAMLDNAALKDPVAIEMGTSAAKMKAVAHRVVVCRSRPSVRYKVARAEDAALARMMAIAQTGIEVGAVACSAPRLRSRSVALEHVALALQLSF